MTVTVPIESGDVARTPRSFAPGVVSVLEFGFAHFGAWCSCGWTGKRHYLRAPANLDAWEHSMREKCDVSVPLVMRVAG
jgi:hypothetical protein